MKVKQVWYLIKDSAAEWSDDNASSLPPRSLTIRFFRLLRF